MTTAQMDKTSSTTRARSSAGGDASPTGHHSAGRKRGAGGWWLVLCMALGLLLGMLIAGGGMYTLFSKVVIPGILQKFQEMANQPPPPTLVSVDQVLRQSVADQRQVTGVIQAVRSSTLAAEESGQVLVAPPDIGTVVHKGDVLAKLDTTLLQKQMDIAVASLAEARALLAEQRATQDQANSLRQRYEQLIKTGGVSQTELDQAVRDQQVAAARLATANATITARQADIAQINERLGKMIVHAPFDGTIIEKLTEVGQWLNPGSPVARLSDWSVVDARIDIPESIIDDIGIRGLVTGDTAEGPELNIDVPSLNKRVTGKLYRVVPSGESPARTYPALIRINNADGRLRPGMTLTVHLTTATHTDALTVPRDAVQVTPSGPRVIVDRNGTAAVVPVVMLFTIGDRFVVTGELQPNELVVTEGNERLSAGMPLKIVGKFADRNPPENKQDDKQPEEQRTQKQ